MQCRLGRSDCKSNIDDCGSVDCSKHGTCVDGIESHTCLCTAGFEGDDCSTAVVINSVVDDGGAGSSVDIGGGDNSGEEKDDGEESEPAPPS